MEAELQEIQNFLSQYPPFDALPEDKLAYVANNTEIAYYRENTPIIKFGDHITDLYMVRSGVVEIYRRKGELYNRLDEGDIFGQMGLLMNGKVRLPATATMDSLIYCIPSDVFNELYESEDTFADFVEVENNTRLRQAISDNKNANDLTTSKVKTLITREAFMLDKTQTIQSAAKLMADENISALLVVDETISIDEENDSQVIGIITDRDLCTRVLAEGLDPSSSVSEVMSHELISLDHNAYIYEAMLAMLRCNVHHLPILKNKQPIG
ncbi:cyclic nucleotide-binding domain-containing protein, partial [Vibrio casei]